MPEQLGSSLLRVSPTEGILQPCNSRETLRLYLDAPQTATKVLHKRGLRFVVNDIQQLSGPIEVAQPVSVQAEAVDASVEMIPAKGK